LPETRKEAKTCRDCGLEAIDDCESQNIHIPDDENSAPCKFCTRNRYNRSKVVADFYDEVWTRDSDRAPIIEDADEPHERLLLRILHGITEGGEKKWMKVEAPSLSQK
jgi:hypothetical protein